jgi:hypothetical protein
MRPVTSIGFGLCLQAGHTVIPAESIGFRVVTGVR